MDFSKFDQQVDLDALKKDVDEAKENGGDYEATPDGTYTVKVEKMEIGETKDGRPMFKAMFRIIEGEYAKRCLFMNRVIYGTKNDANMISSLVGWLSTLESNLTVAFDSYSQFADLVLDIMEDIDGVLEYEVDYKEKAWNPVEIKEVFEV